MPNASTAMTGVLVMTSPLGGADSRADHNRLAETVLVSGEELVGILNDILDFARIDTGRLKLESIDFVVEDVADLLSAPPHDRALELTCVFPTDMSVTVRGDPVRLRSVVRNLVGNAVRFTPSGKVQLKLTVGDGDELTTMVRFEVVGTAMGVAHADQPTLFESLSQVDAETIRSYGAVGLGLAMSHQLVELMGGRIGVKSEPGRGGAFWFTVPLQRGRYVSNIVPRAQHAEHGEQVRDDVFAATPAPRLQPPGRSHQVLLAEDNPVNQRVASAMLENLGFQVDVVADGAQAVQAAASTSYQAILMDGQMPVLDGYQATTEIRRLSQGSRRTPIIAVTGSAMKSDQQRCLAAGMDDYLAKPLNLNTLADILRRWTSDASDPPPASTRPRRPRRSMSAWTTCTILTGRRSTLRSWTGCNAWATPRARTSWGSCPRSSSLTRTSGWSRCAMRSDATMPPRWCAPRTP